VYQLNTAEKGCHCLHRCDINGRLSSFPQIFKRIILFNSTIDLASFWYCYWIL